MFLHESEDVWVGAVPVTRNVAAGKVLLALASSTAVKVPAAPSGAPAHAPVEVMDGLEDVTQDRVFLCVVDQPFVDSRKLVRLSEEEGGSEIERYM